MVNNGVMYVAAPGNQVIAIDARTGTQLWRYRREPPPDMIAMHRVSRGVALYDDKVFFASNAAVLVALDARTGKEVWTATVEDNRKGYYMTAAPVVADGKVMVGVSGGEFGIRGFVAAYDVGTGKEVWRAFTIPAPGEPGHETWPKGDEWKTGGAPTWVSGNYDPATNLLYWGVGNGGPWMGELRPGDNLYVSSTIAIDASLREDRRAFSIQPERVLRLGRSLAAAAHRLQAAGKNYYRFGQRLPGTGTSTTLSARKVQSVSWTRHPYVRADRVHARRSEDRTS